MTPKNQFAKTIAPDKSFIANNNQIHEDLLSDIASERMNVSLQIEKK
jgi:hypothetical protein